MAELVIRRAEERDILSIEQIEKQCFAVPWTYESLRHDILENKLSFYIVAEVSGAEAGGEGAGDTEISDAEVSGVEAGGEGAGGVVCGYVRIWNIVDEGHITNVAVAPAFRRKHIASNLLDVLVASCSQAGIDRFTLEVRAGNEAAKRLYASKGFVEAGLRKGYYEDNGEDAVIMWKEVDGPACGGPEKEMDER